MFDIIIQIIASVISQLLVIRFVYHPRQQKLPSVYKYKQCCDTLIYKNRVNRYLVYMGINK